jgi:hypothetical protein
MSIDAVDVDSPEGNGVESIWMPGFSGLTAVDGGECDFQGGCAFCVWFFAGEFVVDRWWLVVSWWLLVW